MRFAIRNGITIDRLISILRRGNNKISEYRDEYAISNYHDPLLRGGQSKDQAVRCGQEHLQMLAPNNSRDGVTIHGLESFLEWRYS